MSKKLKRRDFIRNSAVAGVTLAAAKPTLSLPTLLIQSGVKPIVIASGNGNHFKNGGDETCVQKAFGMMTKGADVLDAVIAGVNIVELDPLDDSVGYGGLPNADGVVQRQHFIAGDTPLIGRVSNVEIRQREQIDDAHFYVIQNARLQLMHTVKIAVCLNERIVQVSSRTTCVRTNKVPLAHNAFAGVLMLLNMSDFV